MKKDMKDNIRFVITVISIIVLVGLIWIAILSLVPPDRDKVEKYFERDKADFDIITEYIINISGAYVNKNLGMLPVNKQRILSIIIQRQFENPSVIEMQFMGLNHLKLFPNDENYTCEILDATMLLKDDCIYWCDCGGLSEEDIKNYTGTTICASKVRWRAADEYIGSDEVYKSI